MDHRDIVGHHDVGNIKTEVMGNRVSILGLGESGTGAALLAKSKGLEVWASDSGEVASGFKRELEANGIAFEEGGHSLEKILNSRAVVVSPGIPDSAFIISKVRQAGIPLLSEIEFASRFCKGRIFGITGTNGKTTTTLLTYHLLKQGGKSVTLAGNVGTSFARTLTKAPTDFYVVELSSFQLDHVKRFKPEVGCILNISPDHLDRYDGSFIRYSQAKLRICENMDEENTLIINGDDQGVQDQMGELPETINLLRVSTSIPVSEGAFIQDDQISFKPWEYSVDFSKSTLLGNHNKVNLSVAVLFALHAGVQEAAIEKGIRNFKNAPHRLEKVFEDDNLMVINDSKATNTHSTLFALEGLEGKVTWIAGGIDKGNDYTPLYPFTEKVEALYLLGEQNEKFKKAFEGRIKKIKSFNALEPLVDEALKGGKSKKNILFSPACASFDLFKNYEDRGDQFKDLVLKKLKK